MNESVDLRQLLKSWPYDPEKDARFVRGDDGREILQVRTPLGVEQYEVDGRPDGIRPHGVESAMEHHLRRMQTDQAAGREEDFELSPADCAELFNEGTLYYFRYVRFFQLKDWARTIRDTERNLRAFDFVNRYAQRDEDKLYLEKWRPYIMRVRATAAAMMALEQKQHDLALQHLKTAVSNIEQLQDIDDETFKFERERSLSALRQLLKQVEKDRPVSELEKLERQLRRAIERQEFERAAQLRDRIRELKKVRAG